MLIANAPCSWGITYPTGNSYSWQQYLDEVAAAGYRGTELGPFGFLPKDAALLQDELAKRDLMMIGATHVHSFGDAASGPILMQTVRELAPLLVSLGAKHLVIMDESSWYPKGQEGVIGEAGWAGLTRMVCDAQALVEGDYGLKLSFHPHIGTAVERESQIDRLLAETDIRGAGLEAVALQAAPSSPIERLPFLPSDPQADCRQPAPEAALAFHAHPSCRRRRRVE